MTNDNIENLGNIENQWPNSNIGIFHDIGLRTKSIQLAYKKTHKRTFSVHLKLLTQL